jgi:O-antigen ligase
MVALLPALLLCSGYFLPLNGRRIAVLAALTALAVVIVAGATAHSSLDIEKWALDFIVNDIARLNDKYRGLTSGASGRTENYAKAWHAFQESPVLGNGFGEFESVHNGFLLVLAESGLFALMGILFLLVKGIQGYRGVGNWAGAGYILSYSVALMTFPRSFNINMTSLLCIMILMKGLASRVTHGNPACPEAAFRDPWISVPKNRY